MAARGGGGGEGRDGDDGGGEGERPKAEAEAEAETEAEAEAEVGRWRRRQKWRRTTVTEGKGAALDGDCLTRDRSGLNGHAGTEGNPAAVPGQPGLTVSVLRPCRHTHTDTERCASGGDACHPAQRRMETSSYEIRPAQWLTQRGKVDRDSHCLSNNGLEISQSKQ